MSSFLDRASDVRAFAKNAGPQCLRIDYLAQGGRLAYYTPDFFARGDDGRYWLIETKGRVDLDVPTKAKAAIAWCASASTDAIKWRYLYVPQGVFERQSAGALGELASACKPALQNLIQSEEVEERYPLLAPAFAEEDEAEPEFEGLVDDAVLKALSPKARKAVRDAVILYRFMENKSDMNFAPALNVLLGPLDSAARGVLKRRLEPAMPETVNDQKAWFFSGDRYLDRHLSKMANNLKKTLVFNGGYSPIGLLRWCLEYAGNDDDQLGGVFAAVRDRFDYQNRDALLQHLTTLNDFRNNYVAHQEQELSDAQTAREALQHWVGVLGTLQGIQ